MDHPLDDMRLVKREIECSLHHEVWQTPAEIALQIAERYRPEKPSNSNTQAGTNGLVETLLHPAGSSTSKEGVGQIHWSSIAVDVVLIIPTIPGVEQRPRWTGRRYVPEYRYVSSLAKT